jgi:type III pantothenate kinase
MISFLFQITRLVLTCELIETQSMNLVIDIGNTNIKAGLFDKETLVRVFSFSNLETLKAEFTQFEGKIIVSNVSKPSLNDELLEWNKTIEFFSISTPSPVQIDYDTPQTLGVDRIIACVGAYQLTQKACLVVDIGTCITLDFVDVAGVFRGGNISPGPDTRFKSMNNFTASLPLESLNQESKPIGKSTKEALQSGVKFGIIHEIMGTYHFLSQKNPEIQLVLTGGYTSFFDTMLKEGIFAEPNLVLIGLNTLLNYKC